MEQFTQYMHDLLKKATGKFQSAYCREDLAELHKDMIKARGRSAYASRRADLLSALRSCGVSCDRNATDEALAALIGGVDDRATIESRLLQELQALYLAFPSAEDVMTRLVRRLADPEFAEDPVRLAIVKQFLKYTDYHTGPIKTLAQKLYGLTADQAKDLSAVLAVLDERIFDILDEIKTMDKQKQRDARRSYALLKLAEDLAHGWFRTNGKTKTDLYMFAFAFGMTVYTGAEGDVFDPDRDVEKNLFRDYYQDNLLRYIAREYRENANTYESEPSGEGINYKNFAEVIYLYYLRRTDLPAREKIRRAEKLIDHCAAQAGKTKTRPETQMLITDDYRMLFADEIWALAEEDLAEYLLKHFEIPTSKTKAYITAQWGQYAAVNNYLELLDDLDISAGMETDYNGVELFSEELLTRAELTEDFRTLLQKMEQMLRLYMPRAATALAYSLAQDGEEETAQRVLDLAAGLAVLEDHLAGRQLDGAMKQYAQLKDLRQTRADREAKRPETDSQHAARLAYEELKLLHKRQEAAAEDVALLLENFRERAQEIRSTADDPQLRTVTGNLNALRGPVEALLQQARYCAQVLPPLYDRLERKLKLNWCAPYIQLLEQLLELLPLLEHRAQTLFEAEEPWTLTPAEQAQRKEFEKDLEHLERIGRTAIIAAVYHHLSSSEDSRGRSMPQLYDAFCRMADPILEESRYQPISEKNLFDMFTLFELYHSIALDR